MLIEGFPAGMFETNCYVLAANEDGPSLIVDPGIDAVAGVEEICSRRRLRPEAILLTHGHLDHVWSVPALAETYSIPVYIHPKDRPMLTDPGAGLSGAEFGFMRDLRLEEPKDVRDLEGGQTLELAGLSLGVEHTPGHTPGHVIFLLPGVLLTGDLIFAGSVGRTDFPGGSTGQLLASINAFVLSMPDDTAILSGHGPETTVGRERMANPFLRGDVDLGDWGSSR
ncbi:MAG: MBL fold metallo-hydrolase [Actinomycetota bacterium]